MSNPNASYPHQLRVRQLHRWLKRARIAKDAEKEAEILLRMKLHGIHFDENHPEYKKENP